MKLVTGIEAIQSGKPWKHRTYDGWLTPEMHLGSLSSIEMLKKEFIITEEPREFWIDLTDSSVHNINVAKPRSHWIRVREIEK